MSQNIPIYRDTCNRAGVSVLLLCFLTKQLIYLLHLIIVVFMVEETQTVKLLWRFGERENKKHFVESTSAENSAGFVARKSWVVRASGSYQVALVSTTNHGLS